MLQLLFGVMVALTEPAIAPDPASFASEVVPNGWHLVAQVDDAGFVALDRAAVQPSSQYRRLWVRFEFKDQQVTTAKTVTGGIYNAAPFGYLSYVVLEEMDCAERRYRVLAERFYSARNMGGANSSIDRTPETATWRYAQPGTWDEIGPDVVCPPPKP
jgi:hypothetical protein